MGVLRHRAWCAAWAVLAAPAALAQSGNACDQLKATLAARIEATGVRGYSLEAMPAAAPLPKDGRVIGNCEGGAFKMVYRRFGGGDAAPAEAPAPEKAAAPRPEPAKPAVDKPAAEKTAAAKVAVEKPVVEKPLASAPVPSASPTPALSPVAAAAVASPPPTLSSPPPAATSPLPTLESAPRSPAVEAPPASDAVGGSLLPAWWPWLFLGLALPFVLWGWSRLSYRLHYDEAGLPRGPKLS